MFIKEGSMSQNVSSENHQVHHSVMPQLSDHLQAQSWYFVMQQKTLVRLIYTQAGVCLRYTR